MSIASENLVDLFVHDRSKYPKRRSCILKTGNAWAKNYLKKKNNSNKKNVNHFVTALSYHNIEFGVGADCASRHYFV